MLLDICRNADLPSDVQSSDLLDIACQNLAASLHANGIWVGLSEVVLERAPIPGVLSMQKLLSWLPSAARETLAVTQNCFTGHDLTAPSAGPFWGILPIPLNDQLPGLLLLASQQAFDVAELQKTCTSLVRLITITVEHALFKQTISQYRCSMEVLHTLSLRVSSTLDLQEVLNLLAQSTLELLPADAAHIFLYQPRAGISQSLTPGAAAWRDPAQRPPEPLPVPGPLIELINQRNWPLIIDQVETHPLGPHLLANGWRDASLAGCPLLRGGRSLGVFIVSFLHPYTLNAEERYLLSLLTGQAIVAIDNARVAQNMSYHLTELTALQRLAQRISATLNPEQVLQITVQDLKDLLDASTVSIMLVDEANSLKMAAAAGEQQDLPDPPTLKLGEGFAGRVVLEGIPLYIANLGEDERCSIANARLPSLLVVPLTAAGKVIGSLSVNSTRPNAFGPNAERLLSIAATQAATAIENARLYQTEHRRADELNTLMQFSHLITQHLDLDPVFDASYNAIQRLMKCDAFIISLRDRQTREVVLSYIIDKGTRYPSQRRTRGNGLSEYVINTGNVLLLHDLEHQEVPFIPLHLGDQETIRSAIAAPLRSGELIIGMASAQSYQVQVYTQRDLDMLQSVANAIAIAVENSNLYADLQQRYRTLQEADRLRLEFTQNVAHELRTPLTFLRSYIDLLLDGDLGELNDQQHQSLGIVRDKTATMVRIVEDIVILETSGRDWLIIQPVDLERLVRNAILLAQKTAQEKGMAISFHVSGELPAVQADPDRVAQVMDNLLSNAIKFGDTEGSIDIHLHARPEHVQVSVFNQGDAIQLQDQERLFTRFYQVNRRQKGLGLGLAIVKHIIDAHNGSVWVESQPGSGNTFHFTLPYQHQETEKESAP